LQDQLSSACRRLERDKGITAFIRAAEAKDQEKQGPHYTKTINVEGIDQAGIVFKISRFLADRDINIVSLTAQRVNSPGSGTAIYFMEIKAQVPEKVSLEHPEKGLSSVGEELNLDITFR